jgi:hypothetical protein
MGPRQRLCAELGLGPTLIASLTDDAWTDFVTPLLSEFSCISGQTVVWKLTVSEEQF